MAPLGLVLLAASLSPACASRPDPPVDDDATDDDSAPPPEREPREPPPTYLPGVPRMVAVGDIHGDLAAMRDALALAGAIGADDDWIGGDLVVVQTGDQIDRGDDDRAVLDLFEELAYQAEDAGGALYSLVGNHEVMNVELDLRYVNDAAFEAFSDIEVDPDDEALAGFDESERGRAAAFRPGGPYAMVLAGRDMIQIIGDVAFVHGGILTRHVDAGLEEINADTQAWMRGEAGQPTVLWNNDAPVWTRLYSEDPDEEACAELEQVLEAVGASVMVVGHTVQDSITSACDGRAWLIDVGMSSTYGGAPAVLEIVDGSEFTVLD